jgi:HAD superfamily hydrolase (TIGR01490 family)
MNRTTRRAAFFDMDYTVLTIESGLSWMQFLYRRGELSRLGMLRSFYWFALYKLAILDMELLASKLVADLEGDPESEMVRKCEVWYREVVAHRVAPGAVAAIERHRRAGDLVVLLTGSTQYVAEVVGQSLRMDHVLCSRLEVREGRFTGKLAQLCLGRHKVALAEAFAAQRGLDLATSVFYSDSYNDLPMLQRVGTAVAINPDARLRRHARRAGWRIERWRGAGAVGVPSPGAVSPDTRPVRE